MWKVAAGIAGVCFAGMASVAFADDDALIVGALGDSITRAFNAGAPLDQAEKSWSTGDSADALTYSHTGHLRALGHQVRAHNFARSGGKAVELTGQVDSLIASEGGRAPDYVTLLIGANNVCDWSEDHASDLATFRGDVEAAMEKLVTANPDVRVLVVPIPDMLQLWSVGREHGCQARWDLYRMCTPLLGRGKSALDRQHFAERLADANDALADVAAKYPSQALFAHEVSSTTFEWQHISSIDCFHPSEAGQALLGNVTWDAGSSADWFVDSENAP